MSYIVVILVKCLKSLIFCFFWFFRRREIEFALAHRRLSFQCFSLLYRSVFKMAAIQWVTISFVNEFYRVFLWILYLSYFALSWKFFFRATSLEMRYLDRWVPWISRWSNIEFYTLRTYGMWTMLSVLAHRLLRDHLYLWVTYTSLDITKTSPQDNLG
jgi:hypothetical protein